MSGGRVQRNGRVSRRGLGVMARRWRWRRVLATVVALTAVGVPVLGSSSATGATVAGPPSYVALGDSYASGPLIPDQSFTVLGCLQSDHNFAHVTATALGLPLTDMSCAGATTGDMTSSQNVTIGTNPPQLSPLNAGTSVVSLQLGGNDIGFSSIIENCAALTPWGPTKNGQTCKAYYDPNGNDQILARITALAPKIATVLAQIHTAAPSAKVFVLGYPDILPSSSGGCWPSMPLTVTDVPYLYNVNVELDSMLATEAGGNGATYVDTFTPSESHNSCALPGNRWVEPIIPATSAAPVHPNAAGEAGMARALETAMRAQGIS